MLSIKPDSLFLRFSENFLVVFLFLFPFVNYSSFLYPGTTSKAINTILCVSLIGILFGVWLLKKEREVKIAFSPVFAVLALYFIIVVISASNGISFSTSFWSTVARMTGLWYMLNLGFFMIFAAMVLWGRGERAKRKLVGSIVISTALYSVLAFLGPEGVRLLFAGYQSDGFTFGNSTFAGMHIFGAFLLALYYAYSDAKKRSWLYVLPLCIVINPYIINREIWVGGFSGNILEIVGEARASGYALFLSLIALGVIWLISRINRMKARTIVAYSAFALGCAAVFFAASSLLSPNGALREWYLNQATGARPLVWEVSEGVIAERPYFGWGIDNFERVFEVYYDNRLLQSEYGNEAWFDRAHNVFVDQAIDNGKIGLILYVLAYFIAVLSLVYAALHAKDKNDRVFASILIVYFAFHLAELQTAFDTAQSYMVLAFMFACAACLFQKTWAGMRGEDPFVSIPRGVRYASGIILIAFFSWGLVRGVFPFVSAQATNGALRSAGSSEKRFPLYKDLFKSDIDLPTILWRTSTDFQRGIAENPKVLEDPRKVENLSKELVILEEKYKEYLEKNPRNFRAHLNLADILIYSRLMEKDRLEEAQAVLDRAIALVPQSPQPYWMKSVAYLYMRKFDLAREYAKKAYDLNPKIRQSQELIAYIERSIKEFPDIDLFYFRQI